MVMIPVVPTDDKQRLKDEIAEHQRVLAWFAETVQKRDLKPFEETTLQAVQFNLNQAQYLLDNYDAIQADQPVQVPRPTWKKFMQLWNQVDVWACLQCGMPTIVTPDIDLRNIHDPLCPNPPKKP